MKRAGLCWRLVSVTAGLVLLGAAAVAVAAAPPPVVCPKLTSAVTVDGLPAEWAAIGSVTLSADSAQYVGGVPSGPADISAALRCAWDTRALYIFVDVADDILLADSTTIWDDDGVEIAFDGERDRACCGQFDHQLTFVVDGRLGDFGSIRGVSPIRWLALPRQGGYVVEAAIPMTMVLPAPPVSGTVLGFNWGLNDDDDGGRRDKHVLWADSTILNFPLFGDLLLAGAVGTIPTATPSAPAQATPTRTATPVSPGTATPTAPPGATATAIATTPPSPTPTPTAAATPGVADRLAALETGLADLARLLNGVWAVMQAAGSVPGQATPGIMPTATLTARAPGYTQRVNSGGLTYSDSLGAVWAADQPYTPASWGFIGGMAYETSQPIANTPDGPLYSSERYNTAAYQFDLPPAVYRVELRFAEIYQYAAPNQRIFDVALEGTKVITGLDLFVVAGPYTAYNRVFEVSVLDGQLNIDFSATKGAAKVSAIAVAAISYVGPTPTPTLDERVANVESTMTELEQLLLQIVTVFDRFLRL